MNITGHLLKMRTKLDSPVQYQLPLDEAQIAMNELIGKPLNLTYSGEIHCIACGRNTNKSFNQGYCYPCFKRLAECDSCIVKPELCHYFAGTCRDSEWGDAHCMQDHYVYLANSSSIKVGITRGTQIPTRWMDQGATQALPIFRVNNRLLSGLVEVVLKQHVSDKTAWQRMLKGNPEPEDLPARRDELFDLCRQQLQAIIDEQGEGAVAYLHDEDVVTINYPVSEFPTKISSMNFDKSANISGVLKGIKGQYLIFDSGVLNVRKFSGYKITFSA